MGVKTHWVLCLEAEGEPFKKHSTQASAPPCLHGSIITAETMTQEFLKSMLKQINKVIKANKLIPNTV